ncbi:hypothetical protein M427DRAFT_180080, partial [Gonapodya prolifera JEL478]
LLNFSSKGVDLSSLCLHCQRLFHPAHPPCHPQPRSARCPPIPQPIHSIKQPNFTLQMRPKSISKKTANALEKRITRGDDDRFHCPVAGCAVSCTSRWNCSSHLSTHVKDRPHEFFCDLCGTGFHHSGDCSRHMRRCAGEAPACRWCHLQLGGFVKRHRLLKHERTCRERPDAVAQGPSNHVQQPEPTPTEEEREVPSTTPAAHARLTPEPQIPPPPTSSPSTLSEFSVATTYPSPSPSPPPEVSHRVTPPRRTLSLAIPASSFIPSSPQPPRSPSPLPDSPVAALFTGFSLSQLSPHPDPYSQEPMESVERRGEVGPVEAGWVTWKGVWEASLEQWKLGSDLEGVKNEGRGLW